jgi:hypothetical protein
MSVRVFVDEPDFLLRELLACSVRGPEFDLLWRESRDAPIPGSDCFSDLALCGGSLSDRETRRRLRDLRRQHEELPILAYVEQPTAREVCLLLLGDTQGYVPRFAGRARLQQSLRVAAIGQPVWSAVDIHAALRFVSQVSAKCLERLCRDFVDDCTDDCAALPRQLHNAMTICRRFSLSTQERAAMVRLTHALGAPLHAIESELDCLDVQSGEML